MQYAQEIQVGADCYGLVPLKDLKVQRIEYVGIIQYPVLYSSVTVSEVEVLGPRDIFTFRAKKVETVIRGVKSPYCENGRLASWPVSSTVPC